MDVNQRYDNLLGYNKYSQIYNKKGTKMYVNIIQRRKKYKKCHSCVHKIYPKTINMNNYYIYKCLEKFYELPKDIQNVKFTLFKKKLKQYISTHLVPFDTAD